MSPAASPCLKTVPEGAVRWIVIDNEPRLNAFTRDMWEAVPAALAAAEADPETRVVVFTGAGEKAFSAGADISEFAHNRIGEAARTYDAINHRAYEALMQATKPTIAMVHGYCFGGACELAICCDLRIAADTALFSIPAAKLSLGYNPRWIKPMFAVISPAKAKEMLFTGGRYTAAEALAMGLVNQVVPATDLQARVRKIAVVIAANAPLAVRAAKAAVDALAAQPETADLDRLDRLVDTCFSSEDYAEGTRAFIEKRPPVFRGR